MRFFSSFSSRLLRAFNWSGNSEGENNTPRQRKASSKNSEIETCLSTHYEFRYNTVLGRTEYRSRNSGIFTKVGRYEINTLRRKLDCDEGIATSAENLYSIIESSYSPRINPVQEYFKGLPLMDIGSSGDNGNCSSSFLSLKAISDLVSCVVVRNSDK